MREKKCYVNLIMAIVLLVVAFVVYKNIPIAKDYSTLVEKDVDVENNYVEINVKNIAKISLDGNMGYYFVKDDKDYLYVVKLWNRTYNKIEKKYNDKEINYCLKGYIFNIPDDVRDMAILGLSNSYDIDIMKVILMLAVHELGETVIGDLTQFDISKEEKEIIEHEAVSKILSAILDGKEIENLFLEFDSHSTKEAMFAYMCDKLECDLQCKLYDEEGCVDLNKQDGNNTLNNKIVHELLASGASWSEMWLKFGQQIYPYDDNFRSISNYAITHKLRK